MRKILYNKTQINCKQKLHFFFRNRSAFNHRRQCAYRNGGQCHHQYPVIHIFFLYFHLITMILSHITLVSSNQKNQVDAERRCYRSCCPQQITSLRATCSIYILSDDVDQTAKNNNKKQSDPNTVFISSILIHLHRK